MESDSLRAAPAQARSSMRWLRAAQLFAIVTAGAVVALFLANLLFTPVQGSVLVLLSARMPERVSAFTVEIHATAGAWRTLGSVSAQNVPTAPGTAEVIQASAPVGDYDELRLTGAIVSVHFQVQRSVLATILIAVSGGRPLKDGIYAGNEAVSLGLNELAGRLRPMPEFSLTDQFGRTFTNQNLAGHPAIIAAFHTTCHTTCPLYTGLFMQLQQKLPPNVLLIEATTAPQEDTPGVLREYAGRVGASWIFLTGAVADMESFWAPFTVQLSNGQIHSSMLAVIDEHEYIRTVWQGVPDVGEIFPPQLVPDLNAAGLQELASHRSQWGVAQVLDSLQAVGGLSSQSTGGEGPVPDFTLNTLDGRRVSLSDFRGRPVLINFWATYCVPCRTEMPLIETMATAHPKVVVLLVDELDDGGAARQFVSDLKIFSTVLYDGDGRVGGAYGISGLPTTLFVRGDATIEGRYVGQTDERILSSHISAIGA